MKAFGLARLGRDGELKTRDNGDSYLRLSLAVSYGQRDPNTREMPTQWVDAVMWGKRAESLAPYMKKGSVHGFYLSDLHVETFQKNDGGQGVKLAARVDDVDLGPRVDGATNAPAPATQARPPAPPPVQQARPPAPAANAGFSDDDEEIPF